MTYLFSILMGFLQGVAEFLPISSSGHLALFQHFFGMEDVEASHAFFAILLHFGTLVSVCIVYRHDIVDMIREFFLGIRDLASRGGDRAAAPNPARRLVMLIIVGTLPLFVMVPFQDALEGLFSQPVLVSCALIATGFILFFSDRLAKGRKTAKTATVLDALIVGVGQAVAIIPGISRAGTTISVSMLQGFDRNFAVRFSFLLSLPAVLGANILSLIKQFKIGFEGIVPLLPVYLAGMVTAGVVGYFAIRLVKSLADKGMFGNFAYYCWAVGLVSLVAGFLVK